VIKSCNQTSFCSLLLEFSHLLFLFELRNVLPFETLLHLLSETFNSTIEQEKIVVSLFEQLVDIIDSWLFVKVVDNDDFVFLVFVVEHLRDVLISLDVSSWEVQSLSNMIFFVFVRFSQIYQQKICLDSHR